MRVRLTVLLGLALGSGLIFVLQWDTILAWTAQAQRGFQNAMATSLRAAQAGEPSAILALCTATFLYGLVHAAGPGHGKVILGATAMGSQSSVRHMVMLSFASALAQALTAILLVGMVVTSMKWITGREAVDLTEDWLRPLSFVLFLGIGALLVMRGLLILTTGRANQTCSHAHGPSVEQANKVGNLREAAAVVLSIAVRPCTGALFLLVIAAQLGIFELGALATLAMGLGTGVFNGGVAASGVWTRRLASLGSGDGIWATGGLLQMLAGFIVLIISLTALSNFFQTGP